MSNTFTSLTPPSTTRKGAALVRLADGRLLHAGGTNASAVLGTEVYDPNSQSFSGGGTMPAGISYPRAVPLKDGRSMLITYPTVVLYGP